MFCSNCGSRNETTSDFCAECGASLADASSTISAVYALPLWVSVTDSFHLAVGRGLAGIIRDRPNSKRGAM